MLMSSKSSIKAKNYFVQQLPICINGTKYYFTFAALCKGFQMKTVTSVTG